MTFIIDDGGRSAAGYRGDTGDCVVRAIAIAASRPYAEVYKAIAATNEVAQLYHERAELKSQAMRLRRTGFAQAAARLERKAQRLTAADIDRRKVSPRDGAPDHGARDAYMQRLGFTFEPAPRGTRFDLATLPARGRYIVVLRGHFAAVIDGVLHDTYDSRVLMRRVQRVLGLWHYDATKAQDGEEVAFAA